MNTGESIRSEVSSRRRRRGGDVIEAEGEDVGGEGIDVGSWGFRGCGILGEVDMPDSWRIDCSRLEGGRRNGSHLRVLQHVSSIRLGWA